MMNNTLKIVWNATLTAFVITLLAGLIILAMPPSYRATSTIIADANSQVLLRSADLLKEVISETAVDSTYLRNWMDTLLDRQSDTLNLLRQKMSYRHDPTQEIIEVTVEASDPDIAAQLANAAALALLRRSAGSSLTDNDRDTLQADLQRTENDIIELVSANPVLRNPAVLEASLDRQADQIRGRMEKLESELVDARTTVTILRAGDLQPVANQSDTRRLQQRQQQLLARKAELATRYGGRHQRMIALEAELDAVEDEIEGLIRRAEVRALAELETLNQRIAEIESENSDIESRRLELDQRQDQLNDLETQRDRLQMQLRGQSNQIDKSRYSAAIPPESSLGFAQIRLMLLIFVTSFLIVAALQWLRPSK